MPELPGEGFSSHFGFRRPKNFGSCAGLCLRHGPQRTVGAPRLVSTPSPTSGLGSASASARLEAFTEFEGFRSRRFRHDAHLLSPLCLPVSPPGRARAARLSQKGAEGGGGIEPLRTPPPFCINVVYTITYSHCQYRSDPMTTTTATREVSINL